MWWAFDWITARHCLLIPLISLQVLCCGIRGYSSSIACWSSCIKVWGHCWPAHSLYSYCQVLVGDLCPVWMGIVVHHGLEERGMGEHTHPWCHWRIVQPSMCRVKCVYFSLHANTRPHQNRAPARTVMVSNSYGCETLIRTISIPRLVYQ